MFLLDNLLMAPGKAVLFLLEEVAKKAQEEFLDDESVKRELQEIYAMLEAGKISEKDFEAREMHLVERLQQIAAAKFHEHTAELRSALTGAGSMLPDIPTVASEAPLLTGGSLDEARVLNTIPEIPMPVSPEPRVAPPPASVIAPAPSPAPAPTQPGMTMGQVIECATRGLAMLKLRLSSITSAAHDGNGWRVTAELVERRGIPDSSDLLGVYELHLDDAGNLLRYERTRMRRRCDLTR